jgi:hypothetical protein
MIAPTDFLQTGNYSTDAPFKSLILAFAPHWVRPHIGYTTSLSQRLASVAVTSKFVFVATCDPNPPPTSGGDESCEANPSRYSIITFGAVPGDWPITRLQQLAVAENIYNNFTFPAMCIKLFAPSNNVRIITIMRDSVFVLNFCFFFEIFFSVFVVWKLGIFSR